MRRSRDPAGAHAETLPKALAPTYKCDAHGASSGTNLTVCEGVLLEWP